MTPLLWTLVAVQIAMGAFDMVYHHELTERLAWRPSQRHELQLHGIRNLRVVDASIFPRIPGYFIVTPIYMIAEKAADVILDDAVS